MAYDQLRGPIVLGILESFMVTVSRSSGISAQKNDLGNSLEQCSIWGHKLS